MVKNKRNNQEKKVSGGQHPSAIEIETLLSQCDIRRARRSGPGGQHRNKVETAVILHHRPTGIEAEANERRTVAQNRPVAIKRLRLRLAVKTRSSVFTDDGSMAAPSALWKSRCRGKRLSVSTEHTDFPALLAEAIDWLSHYDADLKPVTEQLQISSSQLVGLLKKEPKAFQWLNEQRKNLGLRSLR